MSTSPTTAPADSTGKPLTRNESLLAWVDEMAQPDQARPHRLVRRLRGGEAAPHRGGGRRRASCIPLNQEKLPGCYLHRSNPNDVARVEQLTFICTPTKEEAGPDQQLDGARRGLREARQALRRLDEGPHDVRRPLRDGPASARRMSKVGVELTDSIYVVLNMRIMTRMGDAALDMLGDSQRLQPRPALHARLQPRAPLHLPLPRRTTPSGASAPATAATCCSARSASRCASAATSASNEGWLAEHMLILGVESPEGEMTYVAAAFPSACGKTNFAMMIPPKRFKGWKIWTVGDDIAWMRVGRGRPPLRHQPRGRLLRRRAGDELRSRTPTR